MHILCDWHGLWRHAAKLLLLLGCSGCSIDNTSIADWRNFCASGNGQTVNRVAENVSGFTLSHHFKDIDLDTRHLREVDLPMRPIEYLAGRIDAYTFIEFEIAPGQTKKLLGRSINGIPAINGQTFDPGVYRAELDQECVDAAVSSKSDAADQCISVRAIPKTASTYGMIITETSYRRTTHKDYYGVSTKEISVVDRQTGEILAQQRIHRTGWSSIGIPYSEPPRHTLECPENSEPLDIKKILKPTRFSATAH